MAAQADLKQSLFARRIQPGNFSTRALSDLSESTFPEESVE
jgi:hypothetical protein